MINKTQQQINKEIESLKEAQSLSGGKVNRFGDKPSDAMRAQIIVLENRMGSDEADKVFGETSVRFNVASAARQACSWLEGDSDVEEEGIAAEWHELVSQW